MRVRIRCAYFQPIGSYGDWHASCGCGDQLWTPDWEGAMTFALGHLALTHPRQEQP